MATVKPKSADGYDQAQTALCERVLVTLLRGFCQFKDTLRLVGGLVPRYLTPEQPPDVPAHAGTMDVDIVLNIQVLAEGEGYKALATQLKDQGFSRVEEDGKVSSWRWERKISDHTRVIVEFLRDETEEMPAGKAFTVEGEKISALAIKHAGIVHSWYEECDVTAELLNGGGVATERVRFADAVSFIILKALAFTQRAENKDAGDLIHVMRYYGPGLEALAAEFRNRLTEGTHADAILEALAALEQRFCGNEKVEGYLRDGPVAAANFLHSPDGPEDERVLEQRNASALVTEFLRMVAGDSPTN